MRGRKKRQARPADWTEDDEQRFRFDVITTFFNKGDRKTKEIVALLRSRWPGVGITRESIYPIIEEAIGKHWLLLVPPKAMTLSQRIADLYRVRGERRVHVVSADESKYVAAAAAQLIYHRLKKRRTAQGTLSILLGPGANVALVARYLGKFLQADDEYDWRIRVIALVPPQACRPDINPVSFARYLETQGKNLDLATWSEDAPEPVDVAICQPQLDDGFAAEPFPADAARYQGFQLAKLGAAASVFFVADRADLETMRTCLCAPLWNHLVLGEGLARDLVADSRRTQFDVF
ncbi:MAG: hypothetical protein A2V98_20720 [Planctomycetes bacterium RBG_16_64_12]|nr:MAG: hypothetical protein A2V98_20720 [Planctomycetes bacterium RBG_16_64_12]